MGLVTLLVVKIDLNDRFRAARMSASGRGRVETSNLRDHGVSARSEASGIAAAALCATAGADGFDRGGMLNNVNFATFQLLTDTAIGNG